MSVGLEEVAYRKILFKYSSALLFFGRRNVVIEAGMIETTRFGDVGREGFEEFSKHLILSGRIRVILEEFVVVGKGFESRHVVLKLANRL